MWSVFPSLAAWPVLLMETPPGSLIVAVLLVSGAARCTAHEGSLMLWLSLQPDKNSLCRNFLGLREASTERRPPERYHGLHSPRDGGGGGAQGICYLSDRSYARLGSLPSWYMALRGYLTTLATLSMLSTTAFYFAKV